MLDVEKAQKRYEEQINAGRCKVKNEVGQKVLLSVYNFTLPEGLTLKIMSKIGASFPIMEQLFKDMYKLALPPMIKAHLTFHVSL